MADDFSYTTLPSTLDSRPGLEQTGRLFMDCASTRLGTLLLGNLTPQARAWLDALASQCAADGQRTADRAITHLSKAPRLGIALGPKGTARSTAFGVLLSLPPNSRDEHPIGHIHASVLAAPAPSSDLMAARASIHSAWIHPQYRLRGHSRLLAVAAGEAVAHTLRKAMQHTRALPVFVKMNASASDLASRSFIDSCAEEIHLALLATGMKAKVDLHASLLDAAAPHT